jgi:hypothetical protein
MTAINSVNAAKIARQGAVMLSRLVLGNGRFIYRYRAGETPRPGRKYNVLRHCGSAWSMLDVARRLGGMDEVIDAAYRSLRYLTDECIHPRGDALCVVDDGDIKLGGNGLALLALAELYEMRPEPRLLDTARALGRYIVSEQRPDGDFVHSRVYATGRERDFRSDYYTGEALFGLLRLAEITGETQWVDCAAACEDGLVRHDYGVTAQSHWMLYALERLYAARPRDVYAEHARRIAEHILYFPKYRRDGRSTPIACRSEGLLAYMRLRSRGSDVDASPSIALMTQEVRENLRLQMESRAPGGAFIRGGGSDEVRIDYIQHNISSFLAFSRFVAATGSTLRQDEAGVLALLDHAS